MRLPCLKRPRGLCTKEQHRLSPKTDSISPQVLEWPAQGQGDSPYFLKLILFLFLGFLPHMAGIPFSVTFKKRFTGNQQMSLNSLAISPPHLHLQWNYYSRLLGSPTRAGDENISPLPQENPKPRNNAGFSKAVTVVFTILHSPRGLYLILWAGAGA